MSSIHFPKLTVFILIAIIQISRASIWGTLSVNPGTINQNGIHHFTIDTTTKIPANGYIIVVFPPEVVLSATASCSYYFGLNTNPTCTATGNQIKVYGTGVFPNQYGIELYINYAVNPGSAQFINTYTVKFYNSANTLLDSSGAAAFQFQYLSDAMLSASITPDSYTVGQTTNWIFNFKPKNTVPVGGILQIKFPKWNLVSLGAIAPYSILAAGANTCSTQSGTAYIGSVTCTFTVNAITTGLDTLTITGAFPSASQAASATFQIKVNSCHNLPTTRPYPDFEFYTSDSISNAIDSITAVSLTMTTPATIVKASITVDAPQTVDAQTTYLFQFFAGNPIPVGGEVRVLIPSQVGVGSLTVVIPEQRMNSGAALSSVGGSFYYVKISNGYQTSVDYVPINGLVAFRLQYLVNPSTSIPSLSFHIETWDSSSYIIEQITTGLTVTAATGNVVLNALTYSDTKVLNYDALSFDMTLQSALSGADYIKVTIPSEFSCQTVSTGSCSLLGITGLAAGYQCSLAGNVLTITNPFGGLTTTTNKRVKFTIGNNYCANPTSTRPLKNNFVIQTFSASGNLIDSYSGKNFAATVNSLNTFTVTPGGYITGDNPVTYTFTMQTPHAVEKGAIITLNFPSDVDLTDTNLASSCSSISGFISALSCSSNSQQSTVSGGFSTVCTCTSALSLKINGFTNPRSLQPSGAFSVTINTFDGYQIYELQNGPTVTMTTLNTNSVGSLTQLSGKNGALDQYFFKIVNSNTHMDGDYILLNAPSGITFTSNTLCAASTNVKGFSLCKYISTSQMKITFSFKRRMLSTLNAKGGFTFRLLNIQNPPSFQPTPSFTFTSYTSNNYGMYTLNSGLTVTDSIPGNFSSINIVPTVMNWGAQSDITFTMTPSNYIQGMSMQMQIPSDFNMTAVSTCQAISTNLNPQLTCTYSSSTKTVYIQNAFTLLTKTAFDAQPSALKILQFKIGVMTMPSGKNVTNNFTFTSFDSKNYLADQSLSPLYFTCAPECLVCDTTNFAVCLKCKSNQYLYAQRCYTTCPVGTFADGSICSPCSYQCLSCAGPADNCTVCATGYNFSYPSTSQCLYVCTDGTLSNNSDCDTALLQASFIEMFTNYREPCKMFPFTISAGAATLIIVFIVIISVCINRSQPASKVKPKGKSDQLDPESNPPLRFIELSISIISFIEICGCCFLFCCMVIIWDIYPLIMMGAGIVLNFLLNLIMTCRILGSFENDLESIALYKQRNPRKYRCMQFYSIICSHKIFYSLNSRYKNPNVKHMSQTNFGYNQSCRQKSFFLFSLLFVTGLTIISCALNLQNQAIKHNMYCLDIDILIVSSYIGLLVIITLLQCEIQWCVNRNQILDQKPSKKKKTYGKPINVETDEEEENSERQLKATPRKQTASKKEKYKLSQQDEESIDSSRVNIRVQNESRRTLKDETYFDKGIEEEADGVKSRSRALKSILVKFNGKQADDFQQNDSEDNIQNLVSARSKHEELEYFKNSHRDQLFNTHREHRVEHKTEKRQFANTSILQTHLSRRVNVQNNNFVEEEKVEVEEQKVMKDESVEALDNNQHLDFQQQMTEQVDILSQTNISKQILSLNKTINTKSVEVVRPTIQQNRVDHQYGQIIKSSVFGSEYAQIVDREQAVGVQGIIHRSINQSSCINLEEHNSPQYGQIFKSEISCQEQQIMEENQPLYSQIELDGNSMNEEQHCELVENKAFFEQVFPDNESIQEDEEWVGQSLHEEASFDYVFPDNASISEEEMGYVPIPAVYEKCQVKLAEDGLVEENEFQMMEPVEAVFGDADDRYRLIMQEEVMLNSKPKKKRQTRGFDDQEEDFDSSQGFEPYFDIIRMEATYKQKGVIKEEEKSSVTEEEIELTEEGERQMRLIEQELQDNQYVPDPQVQPPLEEKGFFDMIVDAVDDLAEDLFGGPTAKQEEWYQPRPDSRNNSSLIEQEEDTVMNLAQQLDLVDQDVILAQPLIRDSNPIQEQIHMQVSDNEGEVNGQYMTCQPLMEQIEKEVEVNSEMDVVDQAVFEQIYNEIEVNSEMDVVDEPVFEQIQQEVEVNTEMDAVDEPVYELIQQEIDESEEGMANLEKPFFDQIQFSLKTLHSEQFVAQSQAQFGYIKRSLATINESMNTMPQKQSSTRNHQEQLTEIDQEEIKDVVNKEDIQPKKNNVIFSDKSESSVEDAMEDTPSNYNIPNGRLDEESKGLRSALYKSIVKKFMYNSELGQAVHGREDQEAIKIFSKSPMQQARSQSNNDRQPPQKVQIKVPQKKFDSEQEKLFVKNLVQQQEQNNLRPIAFEKGTATIQNRSSSLGQQQLQPIRGHNTVGNDDLSAQVRFKAQLRKQQQEQSKF